MRRIGFAWIAIFCVTHVMNGTTNCLRSLDTVISRYRFRLYFGFLTLLFYCVFDVKKSVFIKKGRGFLTLFPVSLICIAFQKC